MNVWLGSPSSSAYFFQRRIGSRNVIAIYEDIERMSTPLRNRSSRPSVRPSFRLMSSTTLKIENAWVKFCVTARESVKREIRNFLCPHFFLFKVERNLLLESLRKKWMEKEFFIRELFISNCLIDNQTRRSFNVIFIHDNARNKRRYSINDIGGNYY